MTNTRAYTEKQRIQVLKLYVDGWSRVQIALKTGLSVPTVYSILQRLYDIKKVKTVIVNEA